MAISSGLYGTAYTLSGKVPGIKNVRREMAGRSKTRLRETCDVVAAGTSINSGSAVTRKEINLDDMNVGGTRMIDTVTLIAASNSTTAADAALIDTLVSARSVLGSIDLSGNGGGGKGSNVAPRLG